MKLILGGIAALALAASAASADVVLDSITPGTWQNHPNWLLPTEHNNSGIGAVGVRVIGNGQTLNRFGFVASIWDGAQQVTVAANTGVLRFNIFNSAASFLGADWSPGGGALPYQFGFTNPNWNVPFATYSGVNYYYLEMDLSGLGITLNQGQEYYLAGAYKRTGGPIPHVAIAQGALSGAFGADLYSWSAVPYYGSTEGFINQYLGEPGVTNVAAFVSTVPSPASVTLLGVSALAAIRRRR